MHVGGLGEIHIRDNVVAFDVNAEAVPSLRIVDGPAPVADQQARREADDGTAGTLLRRGNRDALSAH